MNTKAKGSKNERRSMALLEAEGYRCTRAAASLGVFDIIGIGPDNFVACQVKTTQWPGSVEMEAIRALPCPPNCKKIIHRWRKGALIPDVRLVSGTPKLELESVPS